MASDVFDIAVIGAGVVGSAIAKELSRYQLNVALLDTNPDVGMGTSKANTAIRHTGFDAKPDTLEARLIRRSYALMDNFLPEANIAHERLGAILIAWNQEQLDALPSLLKNAHENGVVDVEVISSGEIYRREPNINIGALGALWVPGEGILCAYSVPLACAYQAILNGVELFLDHPIKNIRQENDVWVLVGESKTLRTRYVVNAAGLFSDEINAYFGHNNFRVTPRRGQLIIYDKMARKLINHILLPVPTSITKGLLISPTVYGNILLGPTAEDLNDKTATQTTADGLQFLIERGKEILPGLAGEEVTATYSGLRAATEHRDYQIDMYAEQRYLCVGGIRSTGLSASLGIAEYSVDLLRDAGLDLKLKNDFKPVLMPTIGQAGLRPYQNDQMIARDPSYAEIVCHCERVSHGELRNALNAPIPAKNLDGLRRRTRASQGRCQGFNCHAALAKMVDENQKLTLKDTNHAKDNINIPGGPHMLAGSKNVDVLIVGAGPAGLSAAIELKRLGIRDVLVVDREPEAGGMPRLCHHTGFGRADLWRMYSGPRYAKYYRELAEKSGVEIHASTTITGWNDAATDRSAGRLGFTSPNGLGEITAQAVLLATGVRERPRSARLIPGTRPQGIFTTGSLQRFVYQEHLPVGKRAVIIGAELVSLSALLTLMHAGVKCAMMITEHSRHQIYFPYLPMKWGLADILSQTPIITNAKISNIFGQKRVEGIEISCKNGQKQLVECDAIVFTGNWIPENEMARLGGLVIDSGTGGPQTDQGFRSSIKGVFAAGNLLHGVGTADSCALEGRWAAQSISEYIKKAQWPANRLEIQTEEPIKFISPNILTNSIQGLFQFQSKEFCTRAQLNISQGEDILFSKKLSKIIVNDFMYFDSDWIRKADFLGEPLKATLLLR